MAVDLSALSRGRRTRAPLALIYAPEGCGKTSFACGAPGVLLARAEDGLGTLDVPRFPRDVEDGGTGTFRTFGEVVEFLRAFHDDPSGFATLAFDSVSALEVLIFREVCAIEQVETIEKVGGGFQKGYKRALDLWHVFMSWCEAIRDRGVAVLLIGHSEVERFNDPESDPYDQYKPRIHKWARETLLERCDLVLFLNWRTFTTAKQEGFGKERTRAVSQKRVLYTSKRPAFYAKERFGLPPEIEIPDEPENPTVGWGTFQKHLQEALDRHRQEST